MLGLCLGCAWVVLGLCFELCLGCAWVVLGLCLSCTWVVLGLYLELFETVVVHLLSFPKFWRQWMPHSKAMVGYVHEIYLS